MNLARHNNGRIRGRAMLMALLYALGINLLVFCGAPLLQRSLEHSSGTVLNEVTTFMPINKPNIDEPEPTPPPPPPKLQAKVIEMKPLSATVNLQRPQLSFEVNPRLNMGMAVAPPGPARFELGDVDTLPMATGRIPPPYPYLARRRGVEGFVDIRFLVDLEGNVRHLEVLRAEPTGVFEETVLRTVRRWRFKPGRKDGAPVETWVETSVRFSLDRR